MKRSIHQDQPVLHQGAAVSEASRVVILLHGRGASAESMRSLAGELQAEGTAFLIPQAGLNRWYPETAFGPLERNEPDLSSALELVSSLVEEVEGAGIPKERILLGGFSQGACLAAEYLVRNPERYGGLFVLSGALIGPPGMGRSPAGSLEGTPVFLGGGDRDDWVSQDLFQEARDVLAGMDAVVDYMIYPGMGHTVNQNEIDRVRALIDSVDPGDDR